MKSFCKSDTYHKYFSNGEHSFDKEVQKKTCDTEKQISLLEASLQQVRVSLTAKTGLVEQIETLEEQRQNLIASNEGKNQTKI